MVRNASPTSLRRGVRALAVLIVFGLGSIATLVWLNGQIAEHQKQWESHAAPPDRVGLNAPFITSSDEVVDRMVELAELQPGEVAYDLGCGDGRIIIAAARQSGCRGVGIDIDPKRVAEARENVKRMGVDHLVEIRQQDLFTLDLSEVDVVFMYLLPWMNKKLIPQLQNMRPGARIISHAFGLGEVRDIEPEASVVVRHARGNADEQIYRWIAPIPGGRR